MAEVKPVDEKKVAAFRKVKYENRTEEQWNAIYDANQLAAAYVIMRDPERLEKARVAAVILLEEQSEKDNGYEQVIKNGQV